MKMNSSSIALELPSLRPNALGFGHPFGQPMLFCNGEQVQRIQDICEHGEKLRLAGLFDEPVGMARCYALSVAYAETGLGPLDRGPRMESPAKMSCVKRASGPSPRAL